MQMALETKKYEVGDIYFYPRIGPVQMVERCSETISGRTIRVTKWRPMYEEGLFSIPEDRASDVLRPIASPAAVEEIFLSLADPVISKIDSKHSNRYQAQIAKIIEGTTLDLAELVRDLERRRVYKTPRPLADLEKRNLERAMRSLSQEVGISLGVTPEEAQKRICQTTIGAVENAKPKRIRK